MPKEAKRKWLSFRFNEFNHEHYSNSYTVYSEELPYFREMGPGRNAGAYVIGVNGTTGEGVAELL